jgi:hypothetical protein
MNSLKRELKAIAWIAIPRTGTNFLCSLLKHHPGIVSYYEIFHREKFFAGDHNQPEFIIENINKKYNSNFTDIDDANLVNWIQQQPQELLATLGELNPQRLISFKLFPDQLDRTTIEQSIIHNERIAKILVKRNLLDAYISHEIAQKVGLWNNYDTSNICLSLSVEKFIRWIEKAERWYGLFENPNDTQEINYVTLNYETIHQQATNTEKLAYLDRFFQEIGIEFPCEYSLPDLEKINWINLQKKQDNRTNLADKITNYEEFIAQLKQTEWFDRLK